MRKKNPEKRTPALHHGLGKDSGRAGYRDDGEEQFEGDDKDKDPEELEKEEEEERKKRRQAPPIPVAAIPNRFISNPDIFLMMSSGGGGGRREMLEHSKSETNFDTWIPDSVLKMRAGSFLNKGGVGGGEDTTEEDYSYGMDGDGEEFGGLGSEEIAGFERDVPEDRKDEGDGGEGERIRRRKVSFGIETDEDFSYEEEYEKIQEEGEGEKEEGDQQGEMGEGSKLEEILEEADDGGMMDDVFEEEEQQEQEQQFEEGEGEEYPIEDEEEESEEIRKYKLEMRQLELELGLVERDFGDMPQENVWVEEQILEEYSEESEEVRDQQGRGQRELMEDEELLITTSSEFQELEGEGEVEEYLEEKVAEEVEEILESTQVKEITEGEIIEESELEVIKRSDVEVAQEKVEEHIEKENADNQEDAEIIPEKVGNFVEKENTELAQDDKDAEVPNMIQSDEIMNTEDNVVEITNIEEGGDQELIETKITEAIEENEPSIITQEETEVKIEPEVNLEEEENVLEKVTTSTNIGESNEDQAEEEMGQIEIPLEQNQEQIETDLDLKSEPPQQPILTMENEPEIEKTEEKVEPETIEVLLEPKPEETEVELSPQQETLQHLVEEITKDNAECDRQLIEAEEEEEEDNVVVGTFTLSTKPMTISSDLEPKPQPLDVEDMDMGHQEPEPACDIPSPPEPELAKIDETEAEPVSNKDKDNGKTVEIELEHKIIKPREPSIEELSPEVLPKALEISPEEVPQTEREPEQIQFERSTYEMIETESDNSKTKTIETSVELEDTLTVQDVVVGKVDLEMDIEKIKINQMTTTSRFHPEEIEIESPPIQPETKSSISPASTPTSTSSPIEDEIDKELLSLNMNLPSSQHPHHLHHPIHRSHSSESRRTVSIDRLISLTPVEEEEPRIIQAPSLPRRRPQQSQPPPSSSTSSSSSYRPHMSIYFERANFKRLSSSPSPSLSSSRISMLSQTSTTSLSTPRPTSPFRIEEYSNSYTNPLDISEIRHTILQSSPREFLESFSISSSPRGTPPPSPPPFSSISSRPSTPNSSTHLVTLPHDYDDPDQISPFMTYLFNGAFYLMLSPMLFFVDSLYLALVCLVVVACVHFFIIKF